MQKIPVIPSPLLCASRLYLKKVTVNYNIVADIGEIQKLTAQAAGIGNNLNQIARYFHGGGLASRGMLEELKKVHCGNP